MQEVDIASLRDVGPSVGARGAAGRVVRQRKERAAVDEAVRVQHLGAKLEAQERTVGRDLHDLDADELHEGIMAVYLQAFFFQRTLFHSGASDRKNHVP